MDKREERTDRLANYEGDRMGTLKGCIPVPMPCRYLGTLGTYIVQTPAVYRWVCRG